MQDDVYRWVDDVVGRHDLARRRTLEVGAYNVNGSIDNLFYAAYWGVDIRPGPGVDQVADGEALPFPDDAYEVTIATETLEHVLRPWRFVAEMVRVCAPGGHILLTTVGYSFPEHDVPHDYWRFGHGALESLLVDAGAEVLEVLDRLPDHIYALGRKMGA